MTILQNTWSKRAIEFGISAPKLGEMQSKQSFYGIQRQCLKEAKEERFDSLLKAYQRGQK